MPNYYLHCKSFIELILLDATLDESFLLVKFLRLTVYSILLELPIHTEQIMMVNEIMCMCKVLGFIINPLKAPNRNVWESVLHAWH